MPQLRKRKIPREQLGRLFLALEVCKALDVPAKFRYAIKRNQDLLEPDRKATREGWPEPDVSGYARELNKATTDEARQAVDEKFKDVREKHEKWKKDIEPHLKEEIEIELYETELPEIDDNVNHPQPGPERERQNQTLVEWLMPILKD